MMNFFNTPNKPALSAQEHAIFGELLKIKEHLYESIDPLFRAEERFADKLFDSERHSNAEAHDHEPPGPLITA